MKEFQEFAIEGKLMDLTVGVISEAAAHNSG